MPNPQDEAAIIFKELLTECFKHTIEIKSALRRCYYVCKILGWEAQFNWFDHELNGYQSGMALPAYRKIVGHTEWIPTGGVNAILTSIVDQQYHGEGVEQPVEQVILEVWSGIDWIMAVASGGYVETTGKKGERWIISEHRKIETAEYKSFPKEAFQTLIKNLENYVFNFVTESFSILSYGDSLQNIWLAYRSEVDKKLIPIGLSTHLDSIDKGLKSTNPQDWRSALWSCRDILHDLATYLWRDPRETYDKIKGNEGYLKVTDKEYINRLSAYIHYKGITSKLGAYLRSESERIYSSIKALNELDSKAHGEITLPEVLTAAIGTYIILGEFSTRTDMEPVFSYDE